ncbi:MAG: Tuberculostearic acid methyltransferase UfaA1 [Rhodocyclaceae bacterium]|jgi:cyclopropane-fatty-acyl-phospholipid synthase|nr:Tuberculostearic acid methyltransferase UfaA1 [Rhodocyclaceae bacterium]
MNETLTLDLPKTALPRRARSVLRLLEGLRGGSLELTLPGGLRQRFGAGPRQASMDVADWDVFDAVLARGDIGLAETWIDGLWDSPDPAALLTLLAENRDTLARALYGSAWSLIGARLRHAFNANTRAGSKRNILAHYDLGNDFYRLWLDPTMSYSSALYAGEARPLAAAQEAKNRRILEKLQARPGQRVLEIGCGWGGFAEVAARDGLAVHGITLSPSQLAYAQERMARAGLGDSVRLSLTDYRDLAGRYDHIVSVEMFEAVGERWWPAWFRTVARNLAPEGRAVVQSITIRDDLFARYRKGTDFIQQMVFPGGVLPSVAAFRKQAQRAGLEVREAFAFGRDYGRTLAEWARNFEAAWPQIARLGFDERFRRLWRFYLAYCEAGFAAGSTDVVQFELAHAR